MFPLFYLKTFGNTLALLCWKTSLEEIKSRGQEDVRKSLSFPKENCFLTLNLLVVAS